MASHMKDKDTLAKLQQWAAQVFQQLLHDCGDPSPAEHAVQAIWRRTAVRTPSCMFL